MLACCDQSDWNWAWPRYVGLCALTVPRFLSLSCCPFPEVELAQHMLHLGNPGSMLSLAPCNWPHSLPVARGSEWAL